MIHAARVSELRKRITSHSSNAMYTADLTMSNGAMLLTRCSRSSAKSKAIRNAQKDRLGELLQRKIDIESRIKHCIQGLEIAFKTTSSEIQTCLQYRIESAAKQ